MKKAWPFFLLVTAWLHGYSQITADTLFKNLQVRQTFETNDGKASPAQLQLNFPSGGKGNYLIDAGASLNLGFLSYASVTSSAIGEFHRNTLISSAQNNYQFGYKLRWFERSVNEKNNWRNIIVVNLKYVRNQIDTTNSFAATINWTWYNKSRKGLQVNRPGYFG